MKEPPYRVVSLLVVLSSHVSLFAAVDFTDPTRPMFGGDSSWWSALLSLVGLG